MNVTATPMVLQPSRRDLKKNSHFRSGIGGGGRLPGETNQEEKYLFVIIQKVAPLLIGICRKNKHEKYEYEG